MPSSSIFILGEAWGAEEERERMPFVGPTGWELTRLLTEAGIPRNECFLSNVFNFRPPGGKLENLCGPAPEGIRGYGPVIPGHYVSAQYQPEIDRLGEELLAVDPNLIIAFGNTALWAVWNKTAIKKFRGTTFITTHAASGFKALATYHPAAIFRDWSLRPVVIADLQKAHRESTFPDIRRVYRELWIEPTEDDVYEFCERFIPGASMLSVDIETAGRRVTCIGFAPSPSRAIVIPFDHPRKFGRNYWPTPEIEVRIWKRIRSVLVNPSPPKIFQNGLYDTAFLARAYGVKVAGSLHDTMLLHHALQPESTKDLGFLGATYANEMAWKHMRARKTTKRED
jgi:uracil-DNA glycosylase